MTEQYQPMITGKNTSNTSFGINLLGLILGTLCVIPFRFFDDVNLTTVFIVFAVTTTLSIIAMEYLLYPKTSPLGRLHIQRKLSWKRVLYKEVALLTAFAGIGLLYFLFPMFTYNDFKLQYFPFLKVILPWLLILSLPYFALMDKLDTEEKDIYYKIGYAVIHRKKTITRFELTNFVRSWLVKAFWLSLMQPAMVGKLKWLVNYDWHMMIDNPVEWYWTATVICFFIDLAFASIGYMMNFKIVGTQTKTAEPTLFGWMVAIMCYWPFWGVLFYQFFFKYDSGQQWMKFFETGSFIWYAWFIAIIGLEFLYALATVAGGIRFSNLTYRGLWNTGPYRWTKHPAYVFKNLSWWLISMPFMQTGWQNALRASLLLFGVNIIYYLRAKTEERHLSHYPEYEAYALEMNDKSIFRWCTKLLPFLKYKPLKKEERLF